MIGRDVVERPPSSVDSILGETSVTANPQQHWDKRTMTIQQNKPIRDMIEMILKERTDLDEKERHRFHRIYRITCGESDPMMNVINTIATEAITQIFTVYADFKRGDATHHCVRDALDRMITMMISMGE